jgi:peptide deformylase
MLLSIVKYGNPVLRRKGAPVGELTPEIRRLVADMLETMKDAAGVGLAAQQVGHALQLAVVDVREVQDRPSVMEIDGQTVDPALHMPLVLINPVLKLLGDYALGPEGCLSFPEIYADIPRPEAVEVHATNERGEPLNFRAGGLLSRAIQHEYDHLQGILFIDRMDGDTRRRFRPELESMQSATRAALAR